MSIIGSARTPPEAPEYRLAREVAACLGSSGLLFTGGVGEHAPAVRTVAAEGLGFLGIELEPARNEAVRDDAEIGAAGARVRTLVVTAREDLEIARQVRGLLG